MDEENLSENEDPATEKRFVNFNILFIAIIGLLIYLLYYFAFGEKYWFLRVILETRRFECTVS